MRAELLRGVSLLLAGVSVSPPADSLQGAISDACRALGASVASCSAIPGEQEAELDERVREASATTGKPDLLAVDCAGLFAHGLELDADPRVALRLCTDAAWDVTRAAVNHVFAPTGGRILYIAPPQQAGEYSNAACSALENLARTLSVEWARHERTIVCIAPGAHSHAGEVAALVAYLASPAGAYFSGCLIDLRGP